MNKNILRKTYVDGSYGQIHGRYVEHETATALPLVCLHQSPKSSLEFERFVQAASTERSVYAFDYPGYGNSDAAPSEAETTIEMYAREIWVALDQLNIDRVDLFGNHTGSKVAVEMAIQQPKRVATIAMISASLFNDEERAKFVELFKPIPLDEAHTRFQKTWESILIRRSDLVDLEWMDRSLYQSMMGGEAYEWGHSAAFAYAEQFEHGLKTLPHKKIILNPKDDLQECTRRAMDIMLNGELIEKPNWTYGFIDVQTDELLAELLPRLDAN